MLTEKELILIENYKKLSSTDQNAVGRFATAMSKS